MIIDGHAHPAGDFLKAENIIRIMDENKVDCVVLAGSSQINCAKNQDMSMFEGVLEKHPNGFIYKLNGLIHMINVLSGSVKNIDAGNAYVYQLTRECPQRILQFYWVDPRWENLMDKIKSDYEKYRFKGVKFHQGITRFDLEDACIHEIAQWAGDKGLPVFIHLGKKKDAERMVRLVREHQSTNFIIGHLIGLEVFMETGMAFPNVLFDISCPQIVPISKVLAAVQKFGADRVVMGSDTPYGKENLKNAVQRIKALDLSDREKELILGENFRKLLGLLPKEAEI